MGGWNTPFGENQRRILKHAHDIRAQANLMVAAIVVGELYGLHPAQVIQTRTRGDDLYEAFSVAVYMSVVELDTGKANLARAVERARPTVQRIVNMIEERREDPEFDARLDLIASRLRPWHNEKVA